MGFDCAVFENHIADHNKIVCTISENRFFLEKIRRPSLKSRITLYIFCSVWMYKNRKRSDCRQKEKAMWKEYDKYNKSR